jgi:CMP-N-acetylneuraminic acid synthetase
MKARGSCLIVIPARGGSTGVINKNLKEVHGFTLIQRTFAHAQILSGGEMPICISTDSIEILESLNLRFNLDINASVLKLDSIVKCGEIYIHFRSAAKASSTTLISENLFDIYVAYLNLGERVDGILLLQPTTPFRSKRELIEIKEFAQLNVSKRASLVSVTKVDDIHPARMYSRTSDYRARPLKGFKKSYYSRRQDLPAIFIRDGGFYLIGADLLKKRLQYLRKPHIRVREYPWSINIDSDIDLVQAQSAPSELTTDDPSE